ncbi:hypothetical protein [Pandoraea bronchicola]|uniref:Uncharacterized protein n=1 Tax=Pandoraea bronchicola TaxID=2508287 RepID=A0A5E5BZW7_9BURK|nr:hypothetical protein [Pandoraea bronchicola]VVE90505.1 hypothetical protein PBR20603_04490 [Pandoraea bronchicola]
MSQANEKLDGESQVGIARIEASDPEQNIEPSTGTSTYDTLPPEKKARFTGIALELQIERYFGRGAVNALAPALSAICHDAMHCCTRVKQFREFKEGIIAAMNSGMDYEALHAQLTSYPVREEVNRADA